MSSEISASQLYSQVAAPILEDGSFVKPAFTLPGMPEKSAITLSSVQRDVDLDEYRRFKSTYLQTGQGFLPIDPLPTQAADVVCRVPSPSGQRVFVLRKVDGKKGVAKGKASDDQPVFNAEIFSHDGHLLASSCSAGIHGKVLLSSLFGGVSWRSDERAVAYVAEPIMDKKKDDKNDNGSGARSVDDLIATEGVNINTNNNTSNTAPSSHASPTSVQFEWEADWGEILVGVKMPRVFVLRVGDKNEEKKKLRMVKGLPTTISIGQVQWCPDNRSMVGVAWDNRVDRLGIVYYNTRPCKLVWFPVTDEQEKSEDEKEKEMEKEEKEKEKNKEEEVKVWPIVLTPDDAAAMSPKFSPDGRSMVYLTSDPVLYHRSCSRLRRIDWAKAAEKLAKAQTSQPDHIADLDFGPTTIVDVVMDPHDISSFPGVWCGNWSAKDSLWLSDSRHIVFSTPWRSVEAMVVIDTVSGKVHRIPPPKLGWGESVSAPSSSSYHASWASVNVLDIDRETSRVLCSVSTPACLPTAFVAQLEIINDDIKHEWSQVAPTAKLGDARLQSRLEKLQWEVLQIDPRQPCDLLKLNAVRQGADYKSEHQFEAIIVLPEPGRDTSHILSEHKSEQNQEKSSLPPLIVMPHGGPHSSNSTGFLTSVAYYALAGFAVLMINYRGSSSFGESFLRALPGHCGSMDVDDCIRATDAVLPRVDRQRLVVMGGSHGGFLTCHLIGQFPTLFKAASTRNPVTNMAHSVSSTDITDWNYCEIGLCSSYPILRSYATDHHSIYAPAAEGAPYTLHAGHVPTAKEYAVLFERSPLAHLAKVKTPLLTLLGLMDRRVPLAQGVDYHRILAARGVKARMLIYPNSTHSLADSVSVEHNVAVNTVLWLSGRSDLENADKIKVFGC